MSKHNYSQYSNNKKNNNKKSQAAANLEKSYEPTAEVIEETPVTVVEEPAVVEVKMVEETVETVAVPEQTTGVIINCSRLNIREIPKPDAKIICMLDVGTELKINLAKSTREWFHICTAAGIEGFCMSKFVKAKL